MPNERRFARKSADGGATLKSVAERAGVTAGTVSAVLNHSAASKTIPERTKDRIIKAARELNYRPNFFARSLRNKRTFTIGVMAYEIGDSYSGPITSGIENYLREREYFFLTGAHRHDPQLLRQYSNLLMQRGVEGFVTIDLNLPHSFPVPTVAVAGHQHSKRTTNVVLDHRRAAELALQHLTSQGHKDIALMRGHPLSSDSETRWQSINEVARDFGYPIRPELTIQIETQCSSPEMGYSIVRRLLQGRHSFTALFAYNDLSAIGAVRAIHEAGLRIPDDVSVIGFDDIDAAVFHNPSLTTVRQPLKQMGAIAAETLLKAIDGLPFPEEIAVEPELVLRHSTGPVSQRRLH